MATEPDRPRCKFPGCQRLARPGGRKGAPPRYCHELPGHHRRGAHKFNKQLLAAEPAPKLTVESDPELLVAEITRLNREIAALRAELDIERRRPRLRPASPTAFPTASPTASPRQRRSPHAG